MSHTMKLLERMIENRVGAEPLMSNNQFGFMLGRSIMKAIYLLRRLMERYRKKEKTSYDLYGSRKSI